MELRRGIARKNLQEAVHFRFCLVILLQFAFDSCPATAKAFNASACDPRGTLVVNQEKCMCKANVEGTFCDQCKPGYFHLCHEYNEGCLQCACRNLGSECTAVKLTYSSISLLYHTGQVTDINSGPLPVPITRTAASVIHFASSANIPSFWRANYRGNYVTSYGGTIVVNTKIFTLDKHNQRIAGPTIVLVSYQGIRIANSYDLLTVRYDHVEYSLELQESQWHYVPKNVLDITQYYERTTVTRYDMLNVLTNLNSILIRASPVYPRQTGTQLEMVSWPVGVVSDHGIESSLEQCRCHQGYVGFKCELCAPGYAMVYNTINGKIGTSAECKKANSDLYS